MKGQRSKLLKGAAWVSAGSVFVNALSLLSLIALTRLLVPEDFGLVAIATAFSEILALVTELALATALIQRRDVEPAHFHTAWTMNVLRGGAVAALIALASLPIANFYEDPRLALVIQILALSTLIGSFANPCLVMFQRDLDFSKAFIMQVTNKVTAFVATVGVAFVYQTYWALVIGTLASAVTTVIMSYILIPYMPRASLSKWRDLLGFSVWLTLGKWVQAVNWRAQPLLFGYFLPTPVVGQYNVGRRLISKSINQAVTPIKRLLFPAFSRLQDRKKRLRKGYMRSQGTICLITFPIAIGAAALAEDLVILIIGEKWLPAVPVIQLMAVIRMMGATENVNALAMATAKTKELFFRDLRNFMIRWPCLLAGFFLVGDEPFTMLIGAMMGQTVSVVINTIWNMQLISKISVIKLRDHVAFIWRPFIAALVMGSMIWLTKSASAPIGDFLILACRTVLLAVLGALTYFATLFLIWFLTGRGDTLEKELVGIIRELFAKAMAKVRAV